MRPILTQTQGYTTESGPVPSDYDETRTKPDTGLSGFRIISELSHPKNSTLLLDFTWALKPHTVEWSGVPLGSMLVCFLVMWGKL